jgi:hypothetical protein
MAGNKHPPTMFGLYFQFELSECPIRMFRKHKWEVRLSPLPDARKVHPSDIRITTAME